MKPPRKARRHLQRSPQRLLGTFKFEVQADLLNISLLGLAIRTPVPLEADQQVTCELGEKSDTVSLMGAAVWCRPANLARGVEATPGGYFDIGIRFDHDLPEKPQALLRFLDNATIVRISKGVFSRFELDYDVPIRLWHRYEVRVDELSSLGLRAETDAPLAPEGHIELELPLGDRRFFSRARVVWVKKASGNGDLSRLGVEFFQPTPKHLDFLQRYIEQAKEE